MIGGDFPIDHACVVMRHFDRRECGMCFATGTELVTAEFVFIGESGLQTAIENFDTIRQIKMQGAFIIWAFMNERHIVELKNKIVAKGAINAHKVVLEILEFGQ